MKVISGMKSYFKQFIPSTTSSFFTYFLSAILNLFVSYGLLLLLLRVLPKEQYGQYGLYISVFSMLLILFNFGHKEIIFKFSSLFNVEDDSSKLLNTFRSFIQWNLVIFIATQGLLLIDITWYIVAMAFLLNSWLITGAAYHRGQADYRLDAFALPMQRSFWLIGCIALYFFLDEISLNQVFCAAVVATIMCLVYIILPIFNQFKSVAFNQKHDTNQMKLLFNFFIIEIASVFYLKSDILLLRLFDLDLAIVADYFFAIQLFEIIVLIIMPIGYFYFNALSKKNNGIEGLNLKKYFLPMLGIIVCTHLGILLLAPIIFPVVIPNYTSSINTVLLIIFSLYPVAINILLSSLLIFENKEVLYAKICFTALVFNLILNALLIPNFEIQGVLLTKFLTECFITLLLLKILHKKNSII